MTGGRRGSTASSKGSGLPIKAPVIDMIEIGAGGGSIAAVDELGLLKVGPRSAGADPGPACYGRGGVEPTVTDANLVLGYYDPDFFLGGPDDARPRAAEAALSRIAASRSRSRPDRGGLGHPSPRSPRTWRPPPASTSSRRARDPRRYAMVGFGGAGPAHAADVARLLGVARRDRAAGLGRRLGAGLPRGPASLRVRRARTRCASRPDSRPEPANAVLGELEAQCRARLREAGVADADATVERSADMRLVGQMHEIAVPLPAGPLGAASLAGDPQPPSPRSTPPTTPRFYERADDRGRSRSACAASGRPRRSRCARTRGPRPAAAQGPAPRLLRRRLRRGRRSTTATRSGPARGSTARPSSRSARRPR